MQAPEGVEGYCTTYAECAASYPDAMTKWDAFFQVNAVIVTERLYRGAVLSGIVL